MDDNTKKISMGVYADVTITQRENDGETFLVHISLFASYTFPDVLEAKTIMLKKSCFSRAMHLYTGNCVKSELCIGIDGE